ncbi:MAG TPA: LacI family DNA-binding transcriptional regulator [Opitutales bacterium]|nr:LacI family DNA-binding transcriptional regulator [Opitutales bacterium]
MKKVTMADVARAAGVSKNAVSLALRGSSEIPDATRARIEKTAEKLGYRRSPAVGRVMSMLRGGATAGSAGTIALFNVNQDPKAFRDHPTIPNYVSGCTARAAALGYATDSFWLHEPALSGARWREILFSRSVTGVIFIGLMRENRLPDFIKPVIEAFPCVVTGVRTRQPALSFACTDHHIVALRAFERALSLGYKRPGLVLDREIDELVERRFSAGYMTGQAHIPPEDRLRPFTEVAQARANPELFRRWLETEKPDVIFTLYNVVRHWLEDLGVSVPGQMGLIQLEWRRSRPDWAGMDQHNDFVGAVAVDMISGMMLGGEKGVPPFPRATLVGPTWVDGKTVRAV